jgi:diphthamide biosynthesis enzyme Dph1/Dph2-like protein
MKTALIQLPDGLKQKFTEFCREYEKKGYTVLVWAGSNFGACDIPNLPEELGDILLVNFGHNEFPPKV